MRRLSLFALPPAALLLAAANPATETSHVVEEGETLGGIANRAGVPAAVVAAANGLVEPYAVRVGQTLQIPRQKTHTVKAGDTIGAIAERYGVPFTNIAIANNLPAPYKVRTGETLIIPAVMAGADAAPPPVRTETIPYFRKPHDGRVLAGYSYADGTGHGGVDYAAKTGDMVRASSTGRVVYAQRDSGQFGRLVVLDHGNGWRTRYGHLSRITVKLGETVRAGERVGLAGSDGTADRAKLHFDILRNNEPIDPAMILAQR